MENLCFVFFFLALVDKLDHMMVAVVARPTWCAVSITCSQLKLSDTSW